MRTLLCFELSFCSGRVSNYPCLHRYFLLFPQAAGRIRHPGEPHLRLSPSCRKVVSGRLKAEVKNGTVIAGEGL